MSNVGKAIPHDSATGHVTGSALFIDDHRPFHGELWVEFVGAPVASGLLRKIDLSKAKSTPGVVAVLTHLDLPTAGKNHWGPIAEDEPVLVEELISYLGQPVVVIAAQTREAALRARAAVSIEVTPQKPILTIEDAIAAQSFLTQPQLIEIGNVESALQNSPHIHHGSFESNGQEQFYLESQACIAYPGESGQMKVLSSTQNPTEAQIVVAQTLGLHMNQVVCECKRMGGAFGGKETQGTLPACFTALVAHITGRPARMIYTKDDDMLVTGKRHAYLTRFRAGFDNDGRILALDFVFHSNGGAFADLSRSIMSRTLLHADNAYYIPNARFLGHVCKTNLPPNTAFRGFGAPQSIAAIESIISDIANILGKDAYDIRALNLYADAPRNTTPYGQIVREHVLPQILDQLRTTSDYDSRRRQVDQHNIKSRTTLRGLAMTPVKFGISFTTKFLNQGNALVNLYYDGSIQVSTGGTEMGQGLNTKIRQLVADEFGLTIDRVQMMPTSTEKNINTPPTAASASTDLNGFAALDACQQIKRRIADFAAQLLAKKELGMEPSPQNIRFEDNSVYDDRNPNQRLTLAEFCNLARRERIDMGARGFYATPGVDFNLETGKGNPFFYYTTGAAVAEITIDRFTGDLTVDRVDLLMDVGKMINPGVDLGQIIGGFIQGMGWCTTEDLRYNEKGALLTHSPTTYKIPNITDVPLMFNVNTIDNPHHKRNIRHSKAVGEPPLMLGISVWAAVKDAILSTTPNKPLPLKLPATNEQILLCLQSVTNSSASSALSAPGVHPPWRAVKSP